MIVWSSARLMDRSRALRLALAGCGIVPNVSSLGNAVTSMWVDVQCPGCESPFEVQIAHVACQVYRHCPVCRCLIHLIDSGAGIHRTAEEIDTVVDGFLDEITKHFR